MRIRTSALRAALGGWLALAALAFAPAGGALAQQPAAAAPAEYRLGAGDVVRISVYQVPDLSLEARLSEAGVISYPLLGSVKLGGLSVAEAEQALANGLRDGNFVKQPQVSLLVVQVRGNQASVLGQVNRPGRYPLETAGLRLTELLATAGGVSPNGADVVTLVGTRNGQPFRQSVDLPALFRAGDGKDPVIQDGDAVYVERAPLVYIYGEVQRPGALRLERGMTLLQALAAGGGLTQRGTEKGIRVHRKNAQGEVQVLTPAMDDGVREGDVVFVRESLF
ncbi:polysaccharide export protein EpsE [Rubrivivax albus]|uniref:Polysaccharide export protein EpsE n=1 Tax=Rubrivivax albus TaxID=2499835 RepID=A0A437K032_9BURK|nr:polysaccharide export protein EpsE [Rubrivivax albus]RVT53662.1 polysaccharide export protein EpsE [Rubrivivax albus]